VLLQRLGLTRARVSTLLQQLLEQGLAVSAVERSDGPGRPRTIYRPALRGAA
jgi:predicted ArsR family transcriptional regulator